MAGSRSAPSNRHAFSLGRLGSTFNFFSNAQSRTYGDDERVALNPESTLSRSSLSTSEADTSTRDLHTLQGENERNDSQVDFFPAFQRTRPSALGWLASLRWRRKRPFRYNCLLVFAVVVFFLLGFVLYMWRAEKAIRVRWTPDADALAFSQQPLPGPLARTGILDYELPLRTKGNRIVDARGRRFRLHSVNWYGASDELFVAGGLDVRHRNEIAKTIRSLGFNSVRLPYADQLVIENPVIDKDLLKANPDLQGLRAMDILEAVTTALTNVGIAVIINNHITSATWCCGADPCDAAWSNDYLGSLCKVRQTEDQWIAHWETVMERFIHNPLVIGADLRNEVRGLWGTMPWKKWRSAAERCGNHLLDMNPDWLIIVEGTESANDLSNARLDPVRLKVPRKLVYSAHVYAWSGWGSSDGRFAKRPYESFADAMHYSWGYLLEEEFAPVWVGEVGASNHPSLGDANYWKNLWRYLEEVDADFGYWAINPRKPHDNAKESYALLEDDWTTPVLDYRMKDMVRLIRAEREDEPKSEV